MVILIGAFLVPQKIIQDYGGKSQKRIWYEYTGGNMQM